MNRTSNSFHILVVLLVGRPVLLPQLLPPLPSQQASLCQTFFSEITKGVHLHFIYLGYIYKYSWITDEFITFFAEYSIGPMMQPNQWIQNFQRQPDSQIHRPTNRQIDVRYWSMVRYQYSHYWSEPILLSQTTPISAMLVYGPLYDRYS